MFKSLISLKPSSTLNKHHRIKNIDIITQTINQLFTILNYLELHDIYKLFIIYKKSKPDKQVQTKIILYLTLTERKFTLNQQRKFLKQLTINYVNFSLKQYNTQNNQWKQPINLDIQRTYANPLGSTGFSDIDFIKKPNTFRQYQMPKQPQPKIQLIQKSKIQPIQQSKHNFLSIKFNFLIFSCDDHNTTKRQPDKKKMNDTIIKNYLKNVLNAISNRNKKLGYVQGLNCWIKHMYQSRLTQQEAFVYACFLLQKMKADQLFKNSMTKVTQMCYVFDIYLYNNLPALYYLLKMNDVSSTVYASNWFITLFSQQLSKRIINKIWHLFALKGWKIFIKFGIAVMCVFQDIIKKTPQDQLFCFMRTILQKIDKEKQKKIWSIMSSIKVSNKMINYLQKQMSILFNDTEIQLWRLEQQWQYLAQQRRAEQRRFSFSSCRPTLSKIHMTMSERKIPLINKMIDQQRTSDGCCASYFIQKNNTQTDIDNYSILSACRSVNYQ